MVSGPVSPPSHLARLGPLRSVQNMIEKDVSSKTLAMEMAREGKRYETAVAACIAEIDLILKRIRRQDAQI